MRQVTVILTSDATYFGCDESDLRRGDDDDVGDRREANRLDAGIFWTCVGDDRMSHYQTVNHADVSS